MTSRVRSWAATHPGTVRTHNEDRYLDRPDLGLWAVADGAGGHQAGEVAAQMIVDALDAIPAGLSAGEMLAQVRLRLAATHQALCDEAARRGPATLIAATVVVLIIRDGHYACLWAGDSRAYLMRHGHMTPLTRDHSVVQEMVDAGVLDENAASRHPAANVITRAVGASTETLELDKAIGTVRGGDRFLLCSDGLHKDIDDVRLADLLGSADPAAISVVVRDAALPQGASDNLTALTIQVEAA
jgi:protein phosphatase/serine/threonine-protein phosphatase Stp1